MLTQNEATNHDLDLVTALFELEVDILGAERRPLPMAMAAVASALIVLAIGPLTSLLVFPTIAFFLAFAVYLVLVADAELARRGADQLADGGNESDRT